MEAKQHFSVQEISILLNVSKNKLLHVIRKLGIVYDKKIRNKYYFNLEQIQTIEVYYNNKSTSIKYYPIKMHECFYIYESKINTK